MTDYDPVQLEIFRNLFHSVAEEMGVALCRTSFSPNIKERRDYSCAVFDARGGMVAQGDHMPVHLGSMPRSVEAAIKALSLASGDMAILNDPFKGGTHLPDITLVAPVFAEDEQRPTFYVANRAHHSDVGGISPGSMPVSTTIFQEGIRIPPVLLQKNHELVRETLALILENVRTPTEREGDLTAQIAANRTGERRLLEIAAKYGTATTTAYCHHLQDYAEQMTRAAIHEIPDGCYRFEDCMDDDGHGAGPLPIVATITVTGDHATINFEGTSPQVAGSVNAVQAITLSAVTYCFRIIVRFPIPYNAGTLRPLQIRTPRCSLVDAAAPAAVAGGNVETSQRIVDVVLGALAQALPDRIPAASSGTMNNLTIGGIDPRSGAEYAYYETTAGGMGGRPHKPGLTATHTHMTNTLNTPIEALEHSYPLRVRHYGVRRNSGGAGRFRGGDGIRRDIEVLAPSRVTLLSDRRRHAPYGLQGGSAGKTGRTLLITADQQSELPSKFSFAVEPGSVISIRSPGGGGFGSPMVE